MSQNKPLTNEQKLKIMTAQRRLMAKQLSIPVELKEFETALNTVIAEVTKENDLDFREISLNDDLDIIPVVVPDPAPLKA